MGLRERARREIGDRQPHYLRIRARQGGPLRRGKRSRESPARMTRRTQQREHPVTLTQALRPATDTSKRMRPKNRDKEG